MITQCLIKIGIVTQIIINKFTFLSTPYTHQIKINKYNHNNKVQLKRKNCWFKSFRGLRKFDKNKVITGDVKMKISKKNTICVLPLYRSCIGTYPRPLTCNQN